MWLVSGKPSPQLCHVARESCTPSPDPPVRCHLMPTAFQGRRDQLRSSTRPADCPHHLHPTPAPAPSQSRARSQQAPGRSG